MNFKKMVMGFVRFIKADSYGFVNKNIVCDKVSRPSYKSARHESISIMVKFMVIALVLTVCSHIDSSLFTVTAISNGDEYQSHVRVTVYDHPESQHRFIDESVEKENDDDETNDIPMESLGVPMGTIIDYNSPEGDNENHLVPNDGYYFLMQEGIDIGDHTLTPFDLPDVYYGDIDFSTMQPFMNYRYVTAVGTGAYEVCHSPDCYTDGNGLRRYKTTDDQLTINGQDDYVIALGTFYKPKGVVGTRYLVITTTGMYTAITGDEKADSHTDPLNMFGYCGVYGEYAAVIEWVVDEAYLDYDIANNGTVTAGPIEALQGEILYIYQID